MPKPDGLLRASERAPERPVRLSFSRGSLIRLGIGLLAFELLLRMLYTAPIPSWIVKRWFDLGAPGTIPGWFSSMQLAVISALSMYIAYRDRQRSPHEWMNGWWITSALFLWISMDEVSQIHEGLGDWLGRHYVIALGTSDLFFSWELAFAPLIILFAAYLGLFFWRRLAGRPWLRTLAAAGLLAWILALACEAITEFGQSSRWVKMQWTGLEELLEMAGATVFLLVLLRYATTRTFSDEL